MSLPVLSKKERKKSLFGQKKKRKLKKNILTLPDNLRINNPEFDDSNIVKLASLLESLLPGAKLLQSPAKKTDTNTETVGSEEGTKSDNKLKRNQLLLGINVVSKGVNKGIASCVIFADDIKPKMLTSHITMLCCMKKVPYVYMPNFRELTKKTLGFPCIVLGFKKDSADFLPVIELIHSSMAKKSTDQVSNADTETKESDVKTSNDNVATSSNTEEKTEEGDENFAYLYRSTNEKKRVFVPESDDDDDNDSINKTEGFIALEGSEKEEVDGKKGQNKEKVTEIECLKFMKKLEEKNKVKTENISDTEKGAGGSVKYALAKVMKMGANPVRGKKKCQQSKQAKHS